MLNRIINFYIPLFPSFQPFASSTGILPHYPHYLLPVKIILEVSFFVCCYTKINVCVSLLTIDQKDKFTPRGISAEFVGEARTDRAAVNQVMKGNCQLVFIISPECMVCNRHTSLAGQTTSRR